MVENKTRIKNIMGIHVRPSGLIIEETNSYGGKIMLGTSQVELELNSIMDLLALGLQYGDELEIKVEGEDEEIWLEKLIELFSRQYDFPPK